MYAHRPHMPEKHHWRPSIQIIYNSKNTLYVKICDISAKKLKLKKYYGMYMNFSLPDKIKRSRSLKLSLQSKKEYLTFSLLFDCYLKQLCYDMKLTISFMDTYYAIIALKYIHCALISKCNKFAKFSLTVKKGHITI